MKELNPDLKRPNEIWVTEETHTKLKYNELNRVSRLELDSKKPYTKYYRYKSRVSAGMKSRSENCHSGSEDIHTLCSFRDSNRERVSSLFNPTQG